MKPFTLIVVDVLSLVAVVVAGGLAVMLWRESRKA